MNNFKPVFSTPFFLVEEDASVDGDSLPYYRIVTNPSVICCVLDAADRLVLVRQFRPNLNQYTLEFPAGAIEGSETPLEAAQREVLEEVGMSCKFDYLGGFRLMMNRTSNRDHYFIAISDRETVDRVQEGLDVVKIKRKNFEADILNGQFEQIAALGAIQLINLKYQVDFLRDKNVIDKIMRL